MGEEELEQLILEAAELAEEDNRQKKIVEARNDLESYLYQVKGAIQEGEQLGDLISGEDRSVIEGLAEETEDWLVSSSSNLFEMAAEDFEEKKKELEDVVQPIFAKLYQQSGGGSPPQGHRYDTEDL